MMRSSQTTEIAHVITGLNRGGAETVLARLVTNLSTQRHHVISLTQDGDVGKDLIAAGIPVTALNLSYGRPLFYKLVRALRQLQPRLIQTWMYHGDLVGGLAGRFLKHPRILWNIRNSTLDPLHTKWSTRMVAKACARLSHTIPQKIITCSHAAQHVHEKLGYCVEKFHLIPNGIDVECFRPHQPWRDKIRAEFQLAPDALLIGMVARFDPQKDFLTFLRALHNLPLVKGLLVGPGCTSTNLALMRWIQELELQDRVILAGPRQDIPEILNALDVFVLSSAYGEAFPNVIAEAMACGIPCVATDVGDSMQIIGETGVIVPIRQPLVIAQAIKTMLDQPPANQRQRIVDHYSLSTMVQGYQSLYESLL